MKNFTKYISIALQITGIGLSIWQISKFATSGNIQDFIYSLIGLAIFILGGFMKHYSVGRNDEVNKNILWKFNTWGIMLFEKLRVKFLEVNTLLHKNTTRAMRIYIGIAIGIIFLATFRACRPDAQKLTANISSPGPTKLMENSRPESVTITFNGSAAQLKHVGKIISDGIYVDPPVKGTWRWVSDSKLTFTPKEDWAVGQEYKVKLDSSIFPKHLKLRTYKFSFNSAPFTVSLKDVKFYQDPKNPMVKRVVATAVFSHAVVPEEFGKHIFLQMEGEKTGFMGMGKKSFPFTVTYDKFNGEAYIFSDIIRIPPDDTKMTVVIENEVQAAKGGQDFPNTLSQTVTIPGMYNYFRVESVQATIVHNELYESEQILVLTASADVHGSEIQKNMTVYLLPKNRPPVPGDKRTIVNYSWGDTRIIGPEILEHSQKLELTPIPTDREFTTVHSYKFETEPNQYLYIKLNKGIQAYGGYVLAKPYDTIQRIPSFSRELKIMHDGAVLSLSGDKKLSVISNGIEAIKVTFARVLPGQINHMVSQSGGQFKSPYFQNYRFGTDNITEVFTEIRTLIQTSRPKTQYTAVDFSRYLGAKHGLFFLKVQSWDPVRKRTTGMEDKRLVLVTDLGLLVKEEKDGSRKVFVQSIPSGNSLAGVDVHIIGKNGVPVVTKTTENQGFVFFPPLQSFTNEKEPVAIVAKKGLDLSFIPYNWNDRMLNFSRFDIGGIHTSLSPEKLQAYLFSDRGIYRPGDAIRVGAIIKRGDWNPVLVGIPLETVVIDARGLEIQKQRIRLSQFGFEEILYTTEENGPTGQYQFRVYIVKDSKRSTLLGSVSVKVEEFLPDRMKITTLFSKEFPQGWVTPDNLKGLVMLRNLFGTPAEKRRVAADLTISPCPPFFRAYRDYTFINPNRKKKNGMSTFTERLNDKTTDENGEADFEFDLSRFEKAYYRIDFLASGYEAEAGRGVSSESSIFVSDLPFLLGYKSNSNLEYIKRDSKHDIKIIAIDSKLKQTAVSGLRAVLINRLYVSTLVKQRNGTYKYQSVEKEVVISSKTISIPPEGLMYDLPAQKPGNYIISVRDNEDFELLRTGYSVIGKANLSRSLDKNAELQIKLNKSDFAPGETIEIQITAPYEGAGVITIERDKVYASKWFKTNTTNSIQRITVPENLEGNGYINVSFVRAIDSQEIFTSPLSYAAVPFTVSLARRTNQLKIDIPEIALPGNPYKIKYKSNKKGKVVIFAVDEGILQVAKYKTPDPLAKFFEKRALEVRTSQIVDLILPEFTIFKELFSTSGDGYDKDALSKNLNPFKRKRQKPVAYWSGIIDMDTEWMEVVFDMPDYFNGTVRVMAVSLTDDTIGVTEKKGIVRGPFVLTPNVPTFVAPGDEFEVSIGVHNNVDNSGAKAEIKLQLITSKHTEVIGTNIQTLEIAEKREGVAKFKIRANNVLGSGNFTFIASMVGKQSKSSIDLSIRPPIPYMTIVKGGYLKKRGKAEISVERKLYPHFRVLDTAASKVPIGLAHGLDVYLRNFPYSCTEQLVSQTVPAIVLRKHPEFGYDSKKSDAHFNRAVKILQSRQNAEGAFGFWAANSHVSSFQTVYTLHFLLEAQDAGYPVPQTLLSRGRLYLRTLASEKVESLSQARIAAYAIYVLTRYQEVTTQYADTLCNWLTKNDKTGWEKDVTGIYLAAVYQMHRLNRKAENLISHSRLGDPQKADYNSFYDGLLRDAVYLYIASRYFPERIGKIRGDELINIATPVLEGRFNTTSAAFVIMSLGAYIDVVGQVEPQKTEITEILENGKENTLNLPVGAFPKTQFSEKAVKLLIKNLSDNLLFYQITQAGFDYDMPEKSITQNLEIYREYRKIGGGQISDTGIGEEIAVHLSIRSLDNLSHNNIAVVDLLPGGFEVVPNPAGGGSYTVRIAAPGTTWNPEYADVREDRIVLFGTADSRVAKFVYRIRATNKGKYTVPPPFGESMYDRAIRARGLGDTFNISD